METGILQLHLLVMINLPLSVLCQAMSNPLERLPFGPIRHMLAKLVVPSLRHLLQYSPESSAEA